MSPVTVIDILSRPQLLQHIVDLALPGDALFRLGLVCRDLRPASLDVQAHMYSHKRYLTSAFRHPDAVQKLLNETSVLLTGMPIFTYLTELVTTRAGLTFVADPPVVGRIRALLQNEGLTLQYDTADDPSFAAYGHDAAENPVTQMLAFATADETTYIYIMVARVSPLHVLLMQSSTFMLNGICAGGFFSCYPWASFFLRKGFLARRVVGGKYRVHQAELKALGYTAHDQVTYGRSHNSLLSGARYIGDSWCWLPSYRINPGGYRSVIGQGWSVCERVRLLDSAYPSVQVVNSYISAVPLVNPLLRRTYLTATLTRFYLSRFFRALEHELRNSTLAFVPCRWDEEILPFLQHFYSRDPFSARAHDGTTIVSISFDYSRRVGY